MMFVFIVDNDPITQDTKPKETELDQLYIMFTNVYILYTHNTTSSRWLACWMFEL